MRMFFLFHFLYLPRCVTNAIAYFRTLIQLICRHLNIRFQRKECKLMESRFHEHTDKQKNNFQNLTIRTYK
ncbi:hypothetical protein Hdeb2414_s0006g00208701 [Helianthus debilis subsp. tardiflorus]